MDVISMHQAGFHEAVASLGTSFTEGQAALIKRYSSQMLLAYDSDAAGVRAALRCIGILNRAGIEARVIDLSPKKDPDEFIKAFGPEAFEERIRNAENSFFYELRIKSRDYAMDDPAQRTQFHHSIAAKLSGIRDEIERENYLKEAARRYYVDEGGLRRLTAAYGRSGAAQKVWNEGIPGSAARTPSQANGRRTKTAAEERETRNEKLLLTWLADEPEIFDQIKPYIKPEHFQEGVARKAAQGYWKILEEHGGGNPASVIGMFESEEEQEEAASLFHTRLAGLNDAREREKALKDIIVSVRKTAADREQKKSENGEVELSAESVRRRLEAKKDLQALKGIQLHLKDAPKQE